MDYTLEETLETKALDLEPTVEDLVDQAVETKNAA
jgi:hypothetical protein